MGPIKQSMIGGLLENLGYFLVEILQIPTQIHFSNFEQSAPNALTNFQSTNQSINHKIELPQGDITLFPSKAENIPSVVINSLTSTGSEEVSHLPQSYSTATGLLIIDSKLRNSIILSVLAVLILCLPKGAFVNTDKSRITLLNHKLLLI